MGTLIIPPPSENLSIAMQGVWWLLSREDFTKSGERRIDPVMGADPIGILAYAKEHFSVQFMRRDGGGAAAVRVLQAGSNNTSASGGYDAYFGTYEVNAETGQVLHTLIGSVTPANIGITVSRDLRVIDNMLIIQLETTTPDAEAITRTLTWKRIS